MHYRATPAVRAARVRYRATPAGKASKARYNASPAGRAAHARYFAAVKEREQGLPETPQALGGRLSTRSSPAGPRGASASPHAGDGEVRAGDDDMGRTAVSPRASRRRCDRVRTDAHDHDLYDDDTYELFTQTTEGMTLIARYSEHEDKAEAEAAVLSAACDAAYAIFKANAPKLHYGCPTCTAIDADIPR